jgi:hypothetical protein
LNPGYGLTPRIAWKASVLTKLDDDRNIPSPIETQYIHYMSASVLLDRYLNQ